MEFLKERMPVERDELKPKAGAVCAAATLKQSFAGGGYLSFITRYKDTVFRRDLNATSRGRLANFADFSSSSFREGGNLSDEGESSSADQFT